MKQFLFFCLSTCLLTQAAVAQLGDFSLDRYSSGTVQRRYETSIANPGLKGGLFKNIFIGRNYRKEWQQPVRVPVINFQTDMGGLKPEEEGGGRQTRSLELEDAAGNKWVLRSVRKYPDNVVAPILQGTIAERIVNQGISASYPYAVLSVGTMAKAAGVPYLPNTVVFIPDDPALGEFREKYKNTLSLLELRTPDTTNRKQKTENTGDIIPELFKSWKNDVDQRTVLKGRLLDNFIMDFDRHEGQWEWVKRDSGGRTWYYPIAKDRDQAFFDINGFIPWIARLAQPTLGGQFQGLRAKAANIKTFNFVARDFDRSFLHELDEATWSQEVDQFIASVNDRVIEDAINRQPKEVLPHHGNEIIRTLQEKRQHFKEDMMRYYRFVSRRVSIPGTNERELFNISTEADGTTRVEVATLDSTGQPQAVIYQRSFTPDVTKEIRLYGLEGDDRFIVRGASHAMKVRLIGGPGKDVFTNEGEGRALVYDANFEENAVGEGFRNKLSDDPMVNEYSRLGYPYSMVLPFIGVELTREGGLFLGPTLRITRGGFRKEPYASMHSLYATKAVNSSSYHFRYNADFIGSKKTDLLWRSEAFLPTVRTYFFGYGNNTTYNQEINRLQYLALYKWVDASLQVRYSPAKWLQFSAGPVVQYLQLEDNKNKGRLVSTLFPQNSSNSALYDGQWSGGGEIRMQLNTRNHPVLTTRGIHTNLYARSLYSLSSNNNNDFDQVGGNISFFTDFLWKKVIVLATSFGADRNYGSFLFPQAQYLGWRGNLRGYRVQRFAGRSRAYNNSEIRINFGMANFYFFKGNMGLIGFHDAGRVWVDGEDSDTWHKGYGGGLWVAPFNQVVVVGTVASSKEEKSWLQVSFGFQF